MKIDDGEPSDPQVRSSWLSSTPQSLALTFGRIFDRCGPYSGRATGERL